MAKCLVCSREDKLITKAIGVCRECIRNRFSEAKRIIDESHRKARLLHGLPPKPPKDPNGIRCNICGNKCSIPLGGVGYCGIVKNEGGILKFKTGSPFKAIGLYYLDPHPTNCVADWVCPGATGRGYPKYSLLPTGEKGYYNIAVFYGACNFNCLFCQNWEYRDMAVKGSPTLTIDSLVEAVNGKTTCVCFFGGDPGPQIIHALRAARAMVEAARDKGLKVFRVCWETNGFVNSSIMDKMTELSLETGGIVKIDVKAWSPEIYYALTSSDGRLVFENVKRVAEKFNERPDVPLLVVSTLLVPGYIDSVEINGITKFIAELNPDIPYRLLAFHPDYLMRDLPPTSRRHALEAYEIAKKNGLKNVSIGNWWLLGNYY